MEKDQVKNQIRAQYPEKPDVTIPNSAYRSLQTVLVHLIAQ